MYHPGKVLDVFNNKDKEILSSDDSTQAMVEMWDGNLLTLMVHNNISDKIKVEDVVLVDYRPKEKLPVPNHVIIKILKGDKAKNVWSAYKKRLEKGKQPIKKVEKSFDSYVG